MMSQEMISMILNNDISEIVKIAVENQSASFDGVVQYNYTTGEVVGASFSTGEVENPANPVIEVFRLQQGERGEIDCRCHETGDCPFWIESEDDFNGGHYDENIIDEFGNDRITCCIESCAEDFEEQIQESVEGCVRELLSEHLGNTIAKLNEVRIALSDRFEPHNYYNVRNDDWELRVLDSYVDDAVENGFELEISPRDYLDGEIESICLCLEEDKEYADIVYSLREGNLDGALELLQ